MALVLLLAQAQIYQTQRIVILINGIPQSAPTSISGTISTSSEPLRIGSWAFQDEPFDGIIDEARIYNRALLASEVSSLYSGFDVRDGLAAEYRFDEGTGAAASDTHMWTGGKVGMELQFDGVDDYVEVADSPSVSPTDAITLEAWVWCDTIPNDWSKNRVIFKEAAYNLQIGLTDGVRFELYIDGAYRGLYVSEKAKTGQYQHWKATYNSTTRKMILYLDGGKIGETTLDGLNTYLINDSPYPLQISHTWGYHDGVIDEVRITDNKVSTTVNGTVYMHGKRSWLVEGSSNHDVVIAQLLSREAVEYIRNRKDGQMRGVCFSFWYKPDSVDDSDDDKGEKNKALAHIAYYNGSWH